MMYNVVNEKAPPWCAFFVLSIKSCLCENYLPVIRVVRRAFVLLCYNGGNATENHLFVFAYHSYLYVIARSRIGVFNGAVHPCARFYFPLLYRQCRIGSKIKIVGSSSLHHAGFCFNALLAPLTNGRLVQIV
jgi:hypothetical protein